MPSKNYVRLIGQFLHCHLCRLGFDPTEADDLTQSFFSRLLEKRLLDVADNRRGRFRTFLLTQALRRFIINEWKREKALKRGGSTRRLTLDPFESELLGPMAMAHDMTPDRLYERQWALVVLQRAFPQPGKLNTPPPTKKAKFEALIPFLTRDRTTLNYDELAKRWNSNPGALRMTVSRICEHD